jgi:hypothetical protein
LQAQTSLICIPPLLFLGRNLFVVFPQIFQFPSKFERIRKYNITHLFILAIKFEIAKVFHMLPLNLKNKSLHLLWCHCGFTFDWYLVVSTKMSFLPWTSLFGVNIILHLSKNFFLSLCRGYICRIIGNLKFIF